MAFSPIREYTYIAKPNKTGIPDTKFIVVKVAAH
jgi:hypothetical protein